MDCPEPPSVEGSELSIHNSTDPPLILYQCLSGYTHDGGDLVVECVNGNWTGTIPVCKPIKFPVELLSGVLVGVVIVVGVLIFDFVRYSRRKTRYRARKVMHPAGVERIRPTSFYLTNGEYVRVDYMAITKDALLEIYHDVVGKTGKIKTKNGIGKGKKKVLPPINSNVVNDKGKKVAGKKKTKKKRISPINTMEPESIYTNDIGNNPKQTKVNQQLYHTVPLRQGVSTDAMPLHSNSQIAMTLKSVSGHSIGQNSHNGEPYLESVGSNDKIVKPKKSKAVGNQIDPSHYASSHDTVSHAMPHHAQNAQSQYRPYQTAPSLLPAVQPLSVHATVPPQLLHQTIPAYTPHHQHHPVTVSNTPAVTVTKPPSVTVRDQYHPPTTGVPPGNQPQSPIYHVSMSGPPRALPKLPQNVPREAANTPRAQQYEVQNGAHPTQQSVHFDDEISRNSFTV